MFRCNRWILGVREITKLMLTLKPKQVSSSLYPFGLCTYPDISLSKNYCITSLTQKSTVFLLFLFSLNSIFSHSVLPKSYNLPIQVCVPLLPNKKNFQNSINYIILLMLFLHIIIFFSSCHVA